MSAKLMVAYKIEFRDGSTKAGTVAVPGSDPAAACRGVAGLIRGTSSGKYTRPNPFAGICSADVEDITVTCIGPA